ncbi:MAG: glycosyltransferase family 2 protein [Burkholderiales bacterium]|nr:glycosyltransferase family 2 protein [Burkholderiales bacterium]
MLSIVINVKNGERYLERCLTSVKRFDDVVLLDNYSCDNTLKLARNFPNVRIYESEFTGMGNVKNLAATYAKHDWVFSVDCDEILEPRLVETLLRTQFSINHIYLVYRKNYYNSMLIESSSWGNDWIKRIYNRKNTKFSTSAVHEGLPDNLALIKINGGALIHFPYDEIEQLINKMQFYSKLYAQQYHGSKHPKLATIPVRAFFAFIKSYCLKGGFKQGYEGLIISSFNAIGVYTKYMKLFELDYKKKLAVAIRVEYINKIVLEHLIDYLNQQLVLPQQVFFLISTPGITTEMQQHFDAIRDNLIVPAELIQCEDVNYDLYQQFHSQNNFDCIVLPLDTELLVDHSYLKRCRHAIYKGKHLAKTIFYFNK